MSNGLTVKEIFQKVVNFKPCPRTLKWEFGYLSLTIPRWYREGLPGKDCNTPIPETVSTPAQAFPLPWVSGGTLEEGYASDVDNFFDMDEGFMGVPVNYWLFPGFEEKVIYEDDTYIEMIDNDGIRKREYKDKSSMPLWLEFPVKARSDWEKIKEERLNIKGINKRFYPKIDIAEFMAKCKIRTAPLVIFGVPVGFFGSLRQLMGEEKLLMTYYDDPVLIKDMCSTFYELWISIAEELTSKFDFDAAFFWEDMSYNKGSLISPAMFKEFMSPYYKKLASFLSSKGINKFIVDTDGKVSELIPLFIEVGINMMCPFERQSGNDLNEYRKKYPDLVFLGGFDKNTLLKSNEDIDRELDIISELIKKGGFIPFADHWIPQNVSWEKFKYYRNKLNQIIYNLRILK
ncbi:MAG: hypothetical protein M1308_15385 [Actinobacteria bacterium]|nr:hypothetical protein [Actinomycetota bacterium]